MHDLTRNVRAQTYFPMTQFAPFEAYLAVRSTVEPAAISNMIIDQIEAMDPDLPVLMTEKDAVKAARLGLNNAWSLDVDAVLSRQWEADLLSRVLEEKP